MLLSVWEMYHKFIDPLPILKVENPIFFRSQDQVNNVRSDVGNKFNTIILNIFEWTLKNIFFSEFGKNVPDWIFL